MISDLQCALTQEERQFLITLATAEPDWSLLEIDHLEQLPAIRWKLYNLRQLRETNPEKFRDQAALLAKRLALLT
jgi:hypothetical protein